MEVDPSIPGPHSGPAHILDSEDSTGSSEEEGVFFESGEEGAQDSGVGEREGKKGGDDLGEMAFERGGSGVGVSASSAQGGQKVRPCSFECKAGLWLMGDDAG